MGQLSYKTTVIDSLLAWVKTIYDTYNEATAFMNNILLKDNTASFTPTADYHPATKKYVDEKVSIFWATYGTTTSSECQTAYNAGKVVMCMYNERQHIMSSISPTNDHICLFECYEYNHENGILTLYYMHVLDSSWMNESSIIISKSKSADVTTLLSLPITSKIITASLSGATTMSVSSPMTAGDEIYVVCTPSASFTQPIPNSGSWISMSGSSVSVTSGVPFEISILYTGGYYRVTVKTQG